MEPFVSNSDVDQHLEAPEPLARLVSELILRIYHYPPDSPILSVLAFILSSNMDYHGPGRWFRNCYVNSSEVAPRYSIHRLLWLLHHLCARS